MGIHTSSTGSTSHYHPLSTGCQVHETWCLIYELMLEDLSENAVILLTYETQSSWWFQPLKSISQNGFIFPKFRGDNKTYLKTNHHIAINFLNGGKKRWQHVHPFLTWRPCAKRCTFLTAGDGGWNISSRSTGDWKGLSPTGWWFFTNPSEKCESNWVHLPICRDKNKTYLKPLVLDQVLYQLFLGKIRKSLQSSVSTSVWDLKKQLHTKYRHLMEGFFLAWKKNMPDSQVRITQEWILGIKPI